MTADAPDRTPVPLDGAYRLLNFGPAVLVSTHDGERPNVCTIAWCMPLAKQPPRFALAIGRRHKTFANLQATGELAINVPSAAQRELLLYCGHHSGHDVDKVREGPVPVFPGRRSALPLVRDCAAWLECRLVEVVDAAGHALVIVEACAAAARPGVLDASGAWDSGAFPTLHHAGGRNFVVGGPA